MTAAAQAPVRHATRPPLRATAETGRPQHRARLRPPLGATLTGVGLVAFVAWCAWAALGEPAAGADPLSPQGALTLALFAAAVWLWVFSSVSDTFVALAVAVVLVLMGVLDDDTLFSSLGTDTIWLLLSAFVIAAGVTATGLATRFAGVIVAGAGSLRQLAHLVTAVLVATAYAVPSTSGRAALALPVFLALAKVLAGRRRVVLALALLFPSVILLSAVASYLGAGAHLITSQILSAAGEPSFSFVRWLLLGLPLAVVSSHVCAELILRLFTTAEDRRDRLRITLEDLQEHSPVPLSGPLTVEQSRSALIVATVVALWCTEPLHGLHPAVVALLGALLVAGPYVGAVGLGKALKGVPWSMLVFMAATLTLGTALVDTGAAQWLAHRALGPVAGAGEAAGVLFVVLVVVLSTAAHLVIQSRSARSAVLIPIVIALAPAVGVAPAAVAFASTAAAGFCHTLTSSAKPVTLFSDLEDESVLTYTPADLLRLSAWLAPVMVALVLVFAFWVWPLMGLTLFP
ncbi:SLC13 family permease [Micrococcus sp.]|uniref:SLC13 family permease n=1 Tax=Micrococcus sp. TaxID=1271 RepID=UPI002A917251|nr:SLC13 family permease [Micrococcus sp.]MDY6055093.1 SLC13 family permease [Micrococcus sp.]